MSVNTFDLSKQSVIPLYYQLKEILRYEIVDGKYKPGDMLPSVSEIMDDYNISRHVVNRALSELITEGLVVSRKGVGSFVNHQKLKKKMSIIEGFTSSLVQLGELAHTKVLEKEFVDLPDEVKLKLEVSGNRKGFHLKRLGFVGNEPIAMVVNYYPKEVGEVLAKQELDNISTYEILSRHSELTSTTAEKELSVTFASLDQAGLLNVKEGFALVCIKSLTRNQQQHPFDYSEIFYRSDRVEFKFSSASNHGG